MLAFGVLMWSLHRLVPGVQLTPVPLRHLGWLVVLAGALTSVTAMLQFRRARTTLNPLDPASASALVTTGIFGHSRNPMYLGLLVVLAGWAIVLGSAVPWLVLPLYVLVITRLQIEVEEQALEGLFGNDYREYCARVGRWLGRGRPGAG